MCSDYNAGVTSSGFRPALQVRRMMQHMTASC